MRRRILKVVSNKDWTDIYTQVSYISSTGTQYIKTDFTPILGMDMEWGGVATEEGALFSAGSGDYILREKRISTYKRFLSYFVKPTVSVFQTMTLGSTLKFSIKNNVYSLANEQGTVVNTVNVSPVGAVDTDLYLFYDNRLSECGKCSLGYLICSVNNTEVLHLISCVRNADNVVGMYDLISKKFYINEGTGEFEYEA